MATRGRKPSPEVALRKVRDAASAVELAKNPVAPKPDAESIELAEVRLKWAKSRADAAGIAHKDYPEVAARMEALAAARKPEPRGIDPDRIERLELTLSQARRWAGTVGCTEQAIGEAVAAGQKDALAARK